ncbi:hypothetical protein PUN4_260025 [Paraburkholderia unamae]|nr:hypothetical protein PUN4_260025 [Paraburkholderia unamae]
MFLFYKAIKRNEPGNRAETASKQQGSDNKKRGQAYVAPQHAATMTPVNPAFSTGDGTFGLLVTAARAQVRSRYAGASRH